jgi:hypothetical protein
VTLRSHAGLQAMQSTEAALSAYADDVGDTNHSLNKVLTWGNSAYTCQISEIIITRGCLAIFQSCKLSEILKILVLQSISNPHLKMWGFQP